MPSAIALPYGSQNPLSKLRFRTVASGRRMVTLSVAGGHVNVPIGMKGHDAVRIGDVENLIVFPARLIAQDDDPLADIGW